MQPKNIQVINRTLAVVWNDKREDYFDLEALRRACPCAGCCGEGNVLVAARPAPQNYTPVSFEVRSWQFIGSYGMQPQWADGHATGIYSFAYLRQLNTGN
ncbi:MAG: DUF971 domain-containing protein [Verrucomicrobiota bacterium]|jgi:DUF971 family protein